MIRLTAAITSAWMAFGSPPRADQRLPFTPGEVLTYEVSWSNVITAGRATLAVREGRTLDDGRAAYHITAEVKPTAPLDTIYHLYYKVETLLDIESLRPSQATMYSEERRRTRLRTMRFLRDNIVDYEVQTSTVVRSQFQAEPLAQDPLSALYLLRTMVFTKTQSISIPMVNNGKNYRIRVRVGDREVVTTGVGRMSSWRLTSVVQSENGQPPTMRNVTLWLSDDALRLPLRVAFDLPVGSFVLKLASAGTPHASSSSGFAR